MSAVEASEPSAPAPAGPAGDPRYRLAAAVRRLTTSVVAAELDVQTVEEAARAAEELADRLEAAAGPGRRPRSRPDPSDEAQDFFPTSPVIGLGNPLAPPVRVRLVDGSDGGPREIRADAYFDYPYEGPPACVHGGVIAETFDEVLGSANIAAGNAGMTGTLTVRYRKPTPLRTPLRIEARYLGRTGRKIRTWAGIYHGDVLTAEADGLFIEVLPMQFVAIAERNVDNADPGMLAVIREEAERAASEGTA